MQIVCRGRDAGGQRIYNVQLTGLIVQLRRTLPLVYNIQCMLVQLVLGQIVKILANFNFL
jgi:hypothetical protein